MRALTLLTLTILSFQANAARWSYSCESADGKIKLTRETLVIINKEKLGNVESITVKPANDTINTGPNKGEKLVYKDSFEGKTEGDVSIEFTKELSDKVVEEENGECPGKGHGPGFSTSKKVLIGKVSHYDTSSTKTFTCFETSAWGGNCDFGDEQ